MTNFHASADVFKCLSHPVRCFVVHYLSVNGGSGSCVSAIGDSLNAIGLECSQSSLSQHLKVLKDAGLVVTRREGVSIFYSLPNRIKKDFGGFIEDAVLIFTVVNR